MTRLIYYLTVLFLAACSRNSAIPDDVKWVITKEAPNEVLSKSEIEVTLNKKVDELVLREIALTIREEREHYERLWITYQIEGNNTTTIWASTHFTPDLNVDIIGSTSKEDQITSKTDNIVGEILGKWRSENILMGGTLVLYTSSDGKRMMKLTFKNGGSVDSEIKESKENGLIKYQDDNEHGEYYLLEKNGNLGLYGRDGKIDEAIKIK